MKKPLILVTNDDGITAKGIKSLVEAVQEFGDVVVVAPDSPQSGMGHAITVNQPLRLTASTIFEGIEAYTCTGTPVDCVKLAIYEIFKRKPDILVSGINHGDNSSSNVLYSGTMSAAVEGAMEAIPSVGFSLLDHGSDADFTTSKHVVKKVMQQLLTQKFPLGTCLNVNIPNCAVEDLKGIKICRQGKAHWEDRFDKRLDQFGKPYYWLTGEFKRVDKGSEADTLALDQNWASVVPIQYDMTAHHLIPELTEWDL
ncbi:5'-nucleotidase /3'-nucleotidase /exopolyphosphatase [Lishizhenia tianjinensis]|uniref:5'-nucleotidase SurE n=1 Tax=Lishizhenia tianjinensis TaxID=477690 RepID=A0A1I6XWY9_9FLAO|nr:5'/3'-nucleotidase SurE [Lishizhenia tianjinensis]SFT42810.1 5'-nucleotidase /3'-nucleotidase /exopolyphosphatase [Lishizhenia tianjinensis]